jgi:hypothetical protein
MCFALNTIHTKLLAEELWLLRGGSRGVRLDEVEEGAYLGRRQMPRRIIAVERETLLRPVGQDLHQFAGGQQCIQANFELCAIPCTQADLWAAVTEPDRAALYRQTAEKLPVGHVGETRGWRCCAGVKAGTLSQGCPPCREIAKLTC